MSVADRLGRDPEIPPGGRLLSGQIRLGLTEERPWPQAERRRSPRRAAARHGQPDRRRPRGVPASTAALPAEEGSGRAWERLYLRLVLAVDLLAGTVGAGLAYGVRFGEAALRAEHRYLLGVLVVPLLWVCAVATSRAYESRFFVSGSQELRRVTQASVGLLALVSTVAYALQLELARGYVVIALPVAFVLALVGRLGAHSAVRRRRATGRYTGNVILVGHEWSVLELAGQIRRDRSAGMRVVGACLPAGGGSRQMDQAGVPVLGTLDEAAEVARQYGADAVAVTTCIEFDGDALRRLAWQLEDTRIDLVVAPSLTDVTGGRMHIRTVGQIPLIHVEKPDFSGGRRFFKTLLDKASSFVALVLLLPVFAAIALAVRLTSRGPVIFRQTRVGVRGGEFTVYKFRSMYRDAEARLTSLQQENERAEGLLFKIRHDPRITPVGRVLRRFSVDELPQLANVLRGDMSLVGPRPPLPSEVEHYGLDVQRRLLVRPGLTGLWQVSGRSDLEWEESILLDLRYVENWSLAYDLHILWRTVAAVVRGQGAY